MPPAPGGQASMEANIRFDETLSRIRVLPAAFLEDSQSLHQKSTKFYSKTKEFTDFASKVTNEITAVAENIEHEHTKAIGLRNQVENENEDLERERAILQDQLREKTSQLRRYQAYCESLVRIENEQNIQMEKFKNR